LRQEATKYPSEDLSQTDTDDSEVYELGDDIYATKPNAVEGRELVGKFDSAYMQRGATNEAYFFSYFF